MQYYRRLIVAVALFFTFASNSDAQIVFQVTLDEYQYLKGDWDRWSQTKVGDFVEYSDDEQVMERFEAIAVGDRELTIRTTTYLPYLKKTEQRTIKHRFNLDEAVLGTPDRVTEDKVELGKREFPAKKETYLGFEGRIVKEVWYSDMLPFDGLLQLKQDKPGAGIHAKRIVTSYRMGDVVFGKPDDKTFPRLGDKEPAAPSPTPDPADPSAETDGANAIRVWTSANGKSKVEAELIRATASSIVLKRTSDGKELTIRPSQLSKEDREFLRDRQRSK
jgi:hypothetical protein